MTSKTRPISLRKLFAATVVVSAIVAGFIGTASAGECPADKAVAGATKPGTMELLKVTDTVLSGKL